MFFIKRKLEDYAMATVFERIRSWGTFILAVSFLANVFIKSPVLDELNLALLIAVLVLSLAAVRGSSRIVGYFLFAVGIALLVIYHAPPEAWVTAATRNLQLVVLFSLVPLLSIPIRRGGYEQALTAVFERYVTTTNRFYILLSVLCTFITTIANVAALPLLYYISLASSKAQNQRLVAAALARGFACAVTWAPSAPAVAVVLALTGVHWIDFFPYAFFMAIISGAVGWSVTHFELQSENPSPDQERSSTSGEKAGNWKKLLELLFFGSLLLVGIIVVSAVSGINTLVVVAMASAVFPVIWLGAIKRLPEYVAGFKIYFRQRLPGLKNEFTLFIGAGFLATGIAVSDLGDWIPLFLDAVVGESFVLLSVVVIAVTLAFSGLGIHPIVTITILGTTINPEIYGISFLTLSILLVVAWASGTIFSPSSANAIAISGLLNRSPVEVSVRWNKLYVIALSVILVIVFALMRNVGLLQ